MSVSASRRRWVVRSISETSAGAEITVVKTRATIIASATVVLLAAACGGETEPVDATQTGFYELEAPTTAPPVERGSKLLVDGPDGPLALVDEPTEEEPAELTETPSESFEVDESSDALTEDDDPNTSDLDDDPDVVAGPSAEAVAFCEAFLAIPSAPGTAATGEETKAAFEVELAAMTELLPPREFAQTHLQHISWLRNMTSVLSKRLDTLNELVGYGPYDELVADPAMIAAREAHATLKATGCPEVVSAAAETAEQSGTTDTANEPDGDVAEGSEGG